MRSRAAAAAPVSAGDEVDEAESPTKLRFQETLSWRAGKPISTTELLRRLDELAKELKDLEQEAVDRSSLEGPAKELAQSNLISHKDKGVKALTACCLVDVLRLCAPEAPFTAPQLKEIFTLFISYIIPLIADPLDPYNSQHLYVLDSLSHVKSIVLLTDVPSSGALIQKLFERCFDILSNTSDTLGKNVEYNISGLLQCMVDECQGLPNSVVEMIMAQFLRVDARTTTSVMTKGKKSETDSLNDLQQSKLQLRHLPPAYNVAKNICNTCVERMSRYVSQYFSSTIIGATSARDGEKGKEIPHHRPRAGSDAGSIEGEELQGPSEEDLQNLEKAHRLLRELWRSCPGVLQNVVPQIEAELSAENVQLRLLATETIGDMASGIGATGPPPQNVLDPAAYPPLSLASSAPEKAVSGSINAPTSPQSFAQSHVSAYQNFLGRKNDKSATIRAAWASSVGHILSTSSGGIGLSPQEEYDLGRSLSQMLVDSDEKVRIAAVRSTGLLDFRDFIAKFGPLGGVSDTGSILRNLTDRVKDRKHAVRTEATLLLGKLWGVASGEISVGNERVLNLLGPIPSKIFDAFYVNDPDINCLIDRVLFESLIPLGFPEKKKKEKTSSRNKSKTAEDLTEQDADRIRTERLLLIFRDLDQRGKSVFLALMARPAQLSKYVQALVTRCEDYNGGIMDKQQSEITPHLGKLIEFFGKTLPEPARAVEDLWKFAKNNDRRSYSVVRLCIAEDSDYKKVHKSIKELKRKLEGSSTMSDTLTSLLYKVSNLCYNRSHIHPIIEISQSDESHLATAAHELLKDISAKSPGVFKAHGQELCRFLEENTPNNGKVAGPGTLDALKACASFAVKYPDDVPRDRKFVQAMSQYALRGVPPATAKYAVTILMSSSNKKEMYAQDLLRKCVKGFTYGSDNFLSKLSCLSQLMLLASHDMDEKKDIDPVLDIAIHQILSRVRTPRKEENSAWQDEPDEETEAKTWALKILANRLRSYNDVESVKEISEPVYRLLNNLIVGHGELNKKQSTPKGQASRLRLQAALLLLKLSTKKDFDGLLTPKAFNSLVLVAQDPTFNVREKFVTKVKKYLGQDKLPARFYTIVFLLAFEPVRRLQKDSMTWLRARATILAKAKKPTMEMLLTRFLSLLAHHPDFSSSSRDLKENVQYLMFYFQGVATAENVSLLYHIAQRMKAVQDGIDPSMSENVYYLSDLTVAVINQLASIQNWSMQAYAGKIHPPSGLFAPLPSHKTAQEIANKDFLQSDLSDELETLVRASLRNNKRKSEDEGERPSKRRSTAMPKASSTTPKKTLAIRSPRAEKKSKKSTQKAGPTSRISAPGSAGTETAKRRSGRTAGRKSYAEIEESEADVETEVIRREKGRMSAENPSDSGSSDAKSDDTGDE